MMHAKSSQTLKTRSVVEENSEDHAGASHNPTVIYCTSIKTRISQGTRGSHPSIIIFEMILLQFLIYKWFQCLTHSRDIWGIPINILLTHPATADSGKGCDHPELPTNSPHPLAIRCCHSHCKCLKPEYAFLGSMTLSRLNAQDTPT